MKKLFLPISILTIILVLAGILIFQAGAPDNSALFMYAEIIYVGILALFFILGIYFGIKRITASNEGFPEEDELSRKIIQKAGAMSFYISLCFWLIALYMQLDNIADIRLLFGFGFVGSAMTFVVTWSVLNIRGIADE